ncbi:uncharacterized protein LOC124266498 [Haliotis rubra]|uniref:uncharacterized protein LOC124266498 n=1 Tax=Haliotis rubra TaxID=36100 RepID=UPI001EE5E8BD|nr:uncharacterized protein LOC124266498 [Haliotis rubra]
MQHEVFRVHISGKDGAAKRCHLGGDYQLVVKDSSLCLCGSKLGQVIYEWPYPHIRCYGYTGKAFSFVAGRSSCSGEGMISVKTEDGFAINKSVHEKVQLMKTNTDLKHHRRTTHRSGPLSLPGVRVHRRRKKKRNSGCHGGEFVYSEPYSLSTRCVYSEPYSTSTFFTTCHDYLSMDGTASRNASDCYVGAAAVAGNDEYAELYDDCAGRNNEYTKLHRDDTESYGGGIYETLKPVTRVRVTRAAKGQLL